MANDPRARTALDEDLSALLDGELTPEREAELRARLEQEPALAARTAAFEGVDSALRAMPASEPSVALRERLRERVRAESEPGSVSPGRVRPDAAHRAQRPQRAPRARLPRRWRVAWMGAAVSAAAAGLLIVSLPPIGGRGDVRPVTPVDPLIVELFEANDEDLGIAFDYDTLADLDVIEDLEILELLVALDAADRS